MEEQFAIALRMRASGNAAAARQICRAVLIARPEHRDALNLLAELCFESGDADEAAELCQCALALDPRDPAALGVLGEIYLDCARVADAVTVLRLAAEAAPDAAHRHARLAVALRRAEEHDAAVSSYARAVACRDATARHFLDFATFLVVLGRDDAAIAVLDDAVFAHPDEPRLWWMLADRLRACGRRAAAAGAYRRATACRTRVFGALYDFATLLSELGRDGAALRVAQRAQEVDPRHPLIGDLLRGLDGRGVA